MRLIDGDTLFWQSGISLGARLRASPVGRPPVVAADLAQEVYEAETISIDVVAAATDADRDSLVITEASAMLGAVSIETDGDGSVTGAAGRAYLRYIASDYASGVSDTVSYTITDGTLTDSGVVTVTIRAFSIAYSGNAPTIDIDDANKTATVEIIGNAYQSGPVTITLADLDTGPVAAYEPVAYDANGGTAEDGEAISVAPGIWIGDADDDPLTITGQWYLDGKAIPGETGTSIVVDQGTQGGFGLTYTETATNGSGFRSATSKAILVPSGSKDWTPANEATTSGWWDASDTASLTQSGGMVSAIASQLSGGAGLAAADATHEMILVSSDADFQSRQVLVPQASWTASEASAPAGYIAESAVNVRAIFCVTSFRAGNDGQFDDYNALISTFGSSGDRIMGSRGNANWYTTGRFDNSRRHNGVSLGNTERVLPLASSTLSFIRGSTDSLRLVFGYFQFGNNRPWSGPFAEVVVLDALPDEALIERIEGYLAHKWGLAGVLPAGHTYKSKAPAV